MMQKIHKNKDGYYLIVGIGRYVYLPKTMQNQESVDFITDYFSGVLSDVEELS